MARPKKEGLEYFPHDVFASSDEKIEPLLMIYGANGYAFFFLHLEYIYRHANLSFDVSDAETRQILCQKLHINLEEYEQILKTALKRGCFDKDHYEKTGCLTSNGIKKRAKVVTDKRDKMRQVYESKKEKETVIISDAETRNKPDKGKERKVKESKGKNKEKDIAEKFDNKRFQPVCVSDELWAEFIANRKFKKLQETEKAFVTIMNSFKRGLPQFSYTEMITEYISTRWTRFDPSWMKVEKRNAPKQNLSARQQYMQEVGDLVEAVNGFKASGSASGPFDVLDSLPGVGPQREDVNHAGR